MKKYLYSLVFLLALCANCSPLPDYPFLFIEGSATREVEPNTCELDFEITIKKETSKEAFTLLENHTTSFIDIVLSKGIDSSQIDAHNIRKDSIRNYREKSLLETAGYKLSRRIKVSLNDLSKYDALTSELMRLDHTDLNSVKFGRTDKDMISKELLNKAIQDARSQAVLVADASGQEIVKIRAISQKGFHKMEEKFGLGAIENGRRLPLSMHDRADSGVLSQFVPSTITFSSNIYMIFEMKQN